jgi:hypothetical protein
VGASTISFQHASKRTILRARDTSKVVPTLTGKMLGALKVASKLRRGAQSKKTQNEFLGIGKNDKMSKSVLPTEFVVDAQKLAAIIAKPTEQRRAGDTEQLVKLLQMVPLFSRIRKSALEELAGCTWRG